MSRFKVHLCDLLQSPHKSQGRQNSGLDDYTCDSTSKPLSLLHFGILKSRTWVGLAAFSHATAPYSRAYLSQRQPNQIQTQNSTETVNHTGGTSEPPEEGTISGRKRKESTLHCHRRHRVHPKRTEGEHHIIPANCHYKNVR